MGIEQGTLAPGSTIELPPDLDLPDLRLPRAFQTWTNFRTTHYQQISRIGALPAEEDVALAGELSDEVSQAIGVDRANSSLDMLDRNKFTQLVDFVSGGGNKVIFMRHGEQNVPEGVIPNMHPALKKIRMMQDPSNMGDAITNESMTEAFALGLALMYVQAKTSKRIKVYTSENMRALEISRIISAMASNAACIADEGLNCIVYKNEQDQPPVTTEQLMKALPSGTMPWDRVMVDQWCKSARNGRKQSEVITETIQRLLEEGTKPEGDELLVVLTHTQQLAEVLRLTGKLTDPYARFPEFTMIAVDGSSSVIFPRGVLSEISQD